MICSDADDIFFHAGGHESRSSCLYIVLYIYDLMIVVCLSIVTYVQTLSISIKHVDDRQRIDAV
jgi:hypothetical protein